MNNKDIINTIREINYDVVKHSPDHLSCSCMGIDTYNAACAMIDIIKALHNKYKCSLDEIINKLGAPEIDDDIGRLERFKTTVYFPNIEWVEWQDRY
jgi:hypothetical protein